MKAQALAEIAEIENAYDPVISVSNVVKTYRSGSIEIPAVKGISFEMPRQRFSMVVGPSARYRQLKSIILKPRLQRQASPRTLFSHPYRNSNIENSVRTRMSTPWMSSLSAL